MPSRGSPWRLPSALKGSKEGSTAGVSGEASGARPLRHPSLLRGLFQRQEEALMSSSSRAQLGALLECEAKGRGIHPVTY